MVCSNCGNKFISSAKFCPTCGVIINNSNKSIQHESFTLSTTEIQSFSKKKKILIGCLSLIILYTGYIVFSAMPSSSNEVALSSPTNKNIIPTITTTATEMINTYKNNEVKADRIFKNNYIEIKGRVSSIDSDITDSAVIRLSSKNNYEFTTVMASGDKDFQEKAIDLDKGQTVTLQCIGGGEIVGNPILNNCKIK